MSTTHLIEINLRGGDAPHPSPDQRAISGCHIVGRGKHSAAHITDRGLLFPFPVENYIFVPKERALDVMSELYPAPSVAREPTPAPAIEAEQAPPNGRIIKTRTIGVRSRFIIPALYVLRPDGSSTLANDDEVLCVAYAIRQACAEA